MSGLHTVLDFLQKWVEKRAVAPAFIFRNKRHERYVLTWNKLYALSGRFAAVLRDWGLTRGHLVANTLPNSPERVVCEAGILMSGAASVNAHCLLADGSDILRILRASRASTIVVDPDIANGPWEALKRFVTVDDDGSSVATSESLPELRKVYFVRRVEGKGPGDFLSLVESLPTWFMSDDIAADDVMTVFTTSGTTGFSKLVVYTHTNYINYIGSADQAIDKISEDGQMMFSIAPLGWVGGYVAICFISGFTQVLCDVRGGGLPGDMPEFIWRSIREENCPSAVIFPPYLARIVEMACGQDKHPGHDTETDVIENDDRGPAAFKAGKGDPTTSNGEENAGTGRADSVDGIDKPFAETRGNGTGSSDRSGSVNRRDENEQRPQQGGSRSSCRHDELQDDTNSAGNARSPATGKLDMLLMGGMPISRAMFEKGLLLGKTVAVGYGSTDAGMVSVLMIKDGDDLVSHDTGPCHKGVDVKIVSPEDEDVEVPVNRLGHILVKSQRAPTGYLSDPQSSAAAFTKDGYFRTGDLGRLDDRGHLLVEGRGGDAIMRGAYIFYPGWLEARIGACPGVGSVMVVGVPHPDLNEELCACVVLESDDVTMARVREFVEKDIVTKENDPLSPRPRYYLRFKSFPITYTDKPKRNVLKKMAAAMLGLSDST